MLSQNNQRNTFTNRLIENHVREGMRVLDIGCGNGELTFLLAEAVGKTGYVKGIDINAVAIQAANDRVKESNQTNITFSVEDINVLENQTYDLVFGRRVLMYLDDPLTIINRLKAVLNTGGIMLFQESDEQGKLLNGDRFPLHKEVQDCIWETVRREGGHTNIGSELYGLMKASNMDIAVYNSEVVLQTAETGSDLAWVAEMIYGRMEELGVKLDLDGLEDRLKEEMQNYDAAFVRDLTYGICAIKRA